MAGLVPAIHVFLVAKTWMPGTSRAKTRFALLAGHDQPAGSGKAHAASWNVTPPIQNVSPETS
jgi:hypothetical protein